MIKRIDHICIAVKDTGDMVSLLSNLMGFSIVESVAFPEAGFKSTIISKEDVRVELVEPIGSKGIIQKFIDERGPGIHHFSLEVDDLEEEIELLKAKGAQLVSEKPLQVNEKEKVAFVHPRSTKGVLIELLDRAG